MKKIFILIIGILICMSSCNRIKHVPASPPPSFPLYSENGMGYLIEYDEVHTNEDTYLFNVVFCDYNMIKSLTGYNIYLKNDNDTICFKEISYENYINTTKKYVDNAFPTVIKVEKELLLYDEDGIGFIEFRITRNDSNVDHEEQFIYKVVENEIVHFSYGPSKIEERDAYKDSLMDKAEKDYYFIHYYEHYPFNDYYFYCESIKKIKRESDELFLRMCLSSNLKDYDFNKFINENDTYFKINQNENLNLLEYEIVKSERKLVDIFIPMNLLMDNEINKISFYIVENDIAIEVDYIYINNLEEDITFFYLK